MNYERFIWRDGDVRILLSEEVAAPQESLDS